MKVSSFVSVLVGSTIAWGSTVAYINSPTVAAEVRFVCKKVGGVPTTFLTSEKWGDRQLIRWNTYLGHNGEYTPQRRCSEVSSRMNTYFAEGGQYITHGMMNKKPVICITNSKEQGCQYLLYTLKPRQDAKATLEDLFELNNRNFAGRPLKEGNCPTYVSINDMIQGKKIIAEEVCNTSK